MIEFGDRIAGVSYVERLCAYAVILDGSNAIALVRTRKGYFLPGGGVEQNESLEDALHREIVEELGFESRILKKLAAGTQYVYDKSKDTYFKKVGHFFLAALTEKVSNPADPDHELLWSSPHESLDLFAQEFHAWAVRQINR